MFYLCIKIYIIKKLQNFYRLMPLSYHLDSDVGALTLGERRVTGISDVNGAAL